MIVERGYGALSEEEDCCGREDLTGFFRYSNPFLLLLLPLFIYLLIFHHCLEFIILFFVIRLCLLIIMFALHLNSV